MSDCQECARGRMLWAATMHVMPIRKPLGEICSIAMFISTGSRLPLLWLGTAVLILVAIGLAALSIDFHQEYGKATQAVIIAHRSGAVGPSPEPLFQRAQYAFDGVGLVCLIALIFALKARHPIPLVAFVVCIAILFYTMGQIGIRY